MLQEKCDEIIQLRERLGEWTQEGNNGHARYRAKTPKTANALDSSYCLDLRFQIRIR